MKMPTTDLESCPAIARTDRLAAFFAALLTGLVYFFCDPNRYEEIPSFKR